MGEAALRDGEIRLVVSVAKGTAASLHAHTQTLFPWVRSGWLQGIGPAVQKSLQIVCGSRVFICEEGRGAGGGGIEPSQDWGDRGIRDRGMSRPRPFIGHYELQPRGLCRGCHQQSTQFLLKSGQIPMTRMGEHLMWHAHGAEI